MIYREDFDNASDYIQAKLRARRRKIQLTVLLVVVCVVSVLLFFYEYYKVRNITVEGSTRYTDEEIIGYVCTGFLGDNSLALSIRYRNREMPTIPFVETMSVSVVNHNTITIRVYEKAIAGYVDYLGRYMYFSRDGTVIESSPERLEDVPEVLGLTFSHIILYQKLPVDDSSIFQRILNVTQLLSKYELHADKIYFDNSGNMTVYFGSIKAMLGDEDYTDEKLSTVSRILPKLDGRSGTLKLTQYTPTTDYVTFIVTGNTTTSDATDEDEESSGTDDETDSGTDTEKTTQESTKLPTITAKNTTGTVTTAESAESSAGSDTNTAGDDGGNAATRSIVEEIPVGDTGTVVAGVTVQDAAGSTSTGGSGDEADPSQTAAAAAAGGSTESISGSAKEDEDSANAAVTGTTPGSGTNADSTAAADENAEDTASAGDSTAKDSGESTAGASSASNAASTSSLWESVEPAGENAADEEN